MRVTVPWPDLAGAGLVLLAGLLGAMYRYDKAIDRVRRRRTTASDVADLFSEPGLGPGQPSGRSVLSQILAGPAVISPLPPTAQPNPAQAGEAEEPTDAEEILLASPGPVGWVLAAGRNLVVRTRRASGGHRWLQLMCTAGIWLFLACLALVLVIPLLLVTAFGYVMNSRHDIRLRIIVVLMVVGFALEVITNV